MSGTGSSGPRWRWLSDLAVPACLVVGEATWVSLLVNASYNGSTGPHVRLPYLGFAVPAVFAVAAAALTTRLRWHWWWRALLVAAVAVLGAAATAGGLSELTIAGSVWRVATNPWSSRGHGAAVVAGAAWFVAIVVWIRGTWLGVARPSFPYAVGSAGISAVAFIGVLAGRAAHHDVTFRASTGDAGLLLFVFFALTGAALALIRQREIEEEVLRSSSSGPALRWLTVLAAPMILIAGLSLLVAVGAGPTVRFIGHVLSLIAAAIGSVLAALWHLLPHGSHSQPERLPVTPGHTHAPVVSPLSTHAVHVPVVVWGVVGALLAAMLIWLAWFAIRHVRPYWTRRMSERTPDPNEERDSIFSWAHFFEQIRLTLRRFWTLLRYLWRWPPIFNNDDAPPPYRQGGSSLEPLEGIRREYRRVLAAARRAGSPRAAAETAAEFSQRLGPILEVEPSGPLYMLTALYQRVRYGDARLDETEHRQGREAAGTVIARLESLDATEPSEPRL